MGVVEAIKAGLGTLPQQSVTLRYLLSGAGDITVREGAGGGQALACGSCSSFGTQEAVAARREWSC